MDIKIALLIAFCYFMLHVIFIGIVTWIMLSQLDSIKDQITRLQDRIFEEDE